MYRPGRFDDWTSETLPLANVSLRIPTMSGSAEVPARGSVTLTPSTKTRPTRVVLKNRVDFTFWAAVRKDFFRRHVNLEPIVDKVDPALFWKIV
jgi:hypothetical protein